MCAHLRIPPAPPLTSSRLRARGRYQLLRGRGHDRCDLCAARGRVLRFTRHRRRVGGGNAPVGEGGGRAARNRALFTLFVMAGANAGEVQVKLIDFSQAAPIHVFLFIEFSQPARSCTEVIFEEEFSPRHI
jgi:hypothetical protein